MATATTARTWRSFKTLSELASALGMAGSNVKNDSSVDNDGTCLTLSEWSAEKKEKDIGRPRLAYRLCPSSTSEGSLTGIALRMAKFMNNEVSPPKMEQYCDAARFVITEEDGHTITVVCHTPVNILPSTLGWYETVQPRTGAIRLFWLDEDGTSQYTVTPEALLGPIEQALTVVAGDLLGVGVKEAARTVKGIIGSQFRST